MKEKNQKMSSFDQSVLLDPDEAPGLRINLFAIDMYFRHGIVFFKPNHCLD